MMYLLYVLLVLCAFLVVLNGFLRGSKKTQIDAFLSVVLIGLLIVAFAGFGWRIGLVSLFLTVGSAILLRPLAARIGAKLFAFSPGQSGIDVSHPPRALARISQELGRGQGIQSVNDLLSSSERKRQVEEGLFDYCEQSLAVKQVMQEFGASRTTLRELFSMLLAAGAGQWVGEHYVAASALAYPHALRYVLEGERTNRGARETVYSLIVHFERGVPLQ